MDVQYLRDKGVTPEVDKALRALLSASFVNNQDSEIFARQRYYREMPQHRYLLWKDDILVAHIAVHEKWVETDQEQFAIAGIAEVCVANEYRGQGLVKLLLQRIHQDRTQAGDDFSVLFGNDYVYRSSGYQNTDNLHILNPEQGWVPTVKTMVRALNTPWPKGEVRLIGLPF